MNGLRKTSVGSTLPRLRHRTHPLRWHLVLLVAGALLPVVIFAVAVVYRLSQQEQAASERRALLAARNLASIVEREIAGTIRTLNALAASEELDQNDLSAFYAEAQRVTQTQPTWLTVLLITPTGRQLINTRRPLDSPLDPANEPASLQRVLDTGQPTVGDLAFGDLGRDLAFPVRVPVVRDGQIRYILTAVITPTALASVVEEQSPIEGEWTRTVVDGQGFVLARTRNPERFVGQRGTPSFLNRIEDSHEGVYRDTTLEGERVYVAFTRTSDLRWTVAVTVPVSVIQGPSQRALGLVIGCGIAVLLVSGVGALILSQRISRTISSTARAAEALARGERPQVRPSSIQEVALLGESLEFSANLLAQREQERAENLARAEAARTEAEIASRLKDEFLITVSHELRTPLNAILGWATLLRTGRLDPERQQRAIDIIERNAKTQTRLVEDLLDTSRIITGKLSLQLQSIDLNTVVISAIDSIRHTTEAKGIELTLRQEATAPVWGDPSRLQQVVWNLLSNAVKFTPPGGRIDVRVGRCQVAAPETGKSPLVPAAEVNCYGQIQVSDTGKGITPDFLPYVFDRFRQADGSTTREFGGLGLGLAIVYHLVSLHCGIVQVESEGEGQGATFTIRLPLLQAPKPDSEEAAGLPSAQSTEAALGEPTGRLQGVRVLMVDDEPDAQELVMAILTPYGAEVQTCSSAAEALQAVIDWHPTVILSDIGMPDEDGYGLIRRVRQWESGHKTTIPAAALTAFAGLDDQAKAIAAGFQAHIAKPIEPTKLVALVEHLAFEPQPSR